MKKMFKNVCAVAGVIFILKGFTSLHAFWGFTDYSKLSPAQIISLLEKRQAGDPLDPEINYNLGVAYHKNKDYQKAATCFNRVFINAGNGDEIKNKGLFNAATAMLSKSTAALPESWEKPDVRVDDEILDMAIKDCQDAIDKFQTLLEREAAHAKGLANKKYAEQVLKKLQNKKMQQQQQKQQDKQKNDQNKDNKDNKNQDNKQQQDKGQGGESDSKDQDKKNQNQQQNKDQKNDQEQKNKTDQQQGNQVSDKDKQKQNEQQQNKDKQQEQDKKPEEKRQNNAGQQGGRADQKQDEKQKENEQPDQSAVDKEKNENKPGDQQVMPVPAIQTEEQRAAQALLKQIGNDEGKAQRTLLMKKIATPKGQNSYSQKPW